MSKVSKIVSKIAAASLAVVMAVCSAPQVSFAYVADGSMSYVINFYDDILLDSVTKNGESVEIADNQADYEDTITVKKGAKITVEVTGLAACPIYFKNRSVDDEYPDQAATHILSTSVNSESDLKKSITVPGDATVSLEATCGGVSVYIQMNESEVEGTEDGLEYGFEASESKIYGVSLNEEEPAFFPENYLDVRKVPAGTKLTISMETDWEIDDDAHLINLMMMDLKALSFSDIKEKDLKRTSEENGQELVEYTVPEDLLMEVLVNPDDKGVWVYFMQVATTDPTPSDPTPSNPTDDTKGTTDGSTGTTNDIAKTPVPGGDAENLVLWIALFVVSGGCIAFAGKRKRSMNR